MPAAPKVSVQSLIDALLPVLRTEIAQGIEDALIARSEGQEPASLADIVESSVEKVAAKQQKAATKARRDRKQRRKVQGSKNLPAFPKGFVKGASFAWIKADGSETQHRIVSIEDGVAKTRGLTGFQGTWKSTTIIAALQTKSVKLLPKPSKKAA